jgi:hypothetical protein
MGDFPPEAERAPVQDAGAWKIERADIVRQLRIICADYGDNDWPDNLHLGDAIEKHLARYLEKPVQDTGARLAEAEALLDKTTADLELLADWMRTHGRPETAKSARETCLRARSFLTRPTTTTTPPRPMGTRALQPGERCTNCRHDADIGHAFAQLDEASWQGKSDKYRCPYAAAPTTTPGAAWRTALERIARDSDDDREPARSIASRALSPTPWCRICPHPEHTGDCAAFDIAFAPDNRCPCSR